MKNKCDWRHKTEYCSVCGAEPYKETYCKGCGSLLKHPKEKCPNCKAMYKYNKLGA